MFHRERGVAQRDRAELEAANRQEAIRQSLRYIRGVRDGVAATEAITPNNSQRLMEMIREAKDLAIDVARNVNLSDVALRQSMRDAASIADNYLGRLNYEVLAAHELKGNSVIPDIQGDREAATRALDQLIADYSQLRALPAL
jgi:5'-3' exonuclease